MHNFINLFMDKKGELFQLFMQHLNMTTIHAVTFIRVGAKTEKPFALTAYLKDIEDCML